MMTRYLLLLLLIAAPAQAATLYKWVDSQGRTHITDTPPPAGRTAERISVERGAVEPADRSDRKNAGPSDEFRRLEAQAKRAQAKAGAAYRRRQCEQTRSARGQMLAAADPGSQDEQRQASLSRLERDIEKWCG